VRGASFTDRTHVGIPNSLGIFEIGTPNQKEKYLPYCYWIYAITSLRQHTPWEVDHNQDRHALDENKTPQAIREIFVCDRPTILIATPDSASNNKTVTQKQCRADVLPDYGILNVWIVVKAGLRIMPSSRHLTYCEKWANDCDAHTKKDQPPTNAFRAH
jgi:hypothetical protein